MPLNSGIFFGFFGVFFILYWFVFKKQLRLQNLLILAGSYIFYAWWDWRFISLLFAHTTINYFLGFYIEKTTKERYRKYLLYIGVFLGIGTLLLFKYFNFFIGSISNMLSDLNFSLDSFILQIIFPLGISFYTFKTLSYLWDIYNGKIKATKDWVVFYSYASFFPTMMSGPIDRAKTFVPQLEKVRVFEYNQATDGLRQILWGLFKKIVIANNCALLTNQVFEHYETLPASSLFFGAFFYTIQIYADFSGYSDMAIGFSQLIGFKVTKNFDFPFFTTNLSKFWRKWHMSLTTWFTDYVFTPLSITFREYGKAGLILAILINFTLIGIWHGTNWTFVLFGFLHGVYFIPMVLTGTLNKKKKQGNDYRLSVVGIMNMFGTFLIVMVTFILVRADSVPEALNYVQRLFSPTIFSKPQFEDKAQLLMTMGLVSFCFIIEWFGQQDDFAIEKLVLRWPVILRWSFYLGLVLLLLVFNDTPQEFIYARF